VGLTRKGVKKIKEQVPVFFFGSLALPGCKNAGWYLCVFSLLADSLVVNILMDHEVVQQKQESVY
jgi:hypothetical protein